MATTNSGLAQYYQQNPSALYNFAGIDKRYNNQYWNNKPRYVNPEISTFAGYNTGSNYSPFAGTTFGGNDIISNYSNNVNTSDFMNYNRQNLSPAFSGINSNNVSALGNGSNPIFNSKTMSNWYGGLDYDAMSNAGMSPEQIASFAKGYRSPLEKGLGAFAAGTSIAGGLYEMYLGNKQDKREENLANLTEKIANNELQRRTDFQNNYNKSM